MIVTEDEAKGKACCGGAGCGSADPRVEAAEGDYLRYCIGSACMAWRWWGYRDSDGQVVNDVSGPKPRVGCCGRAGA